MFFEYLGRKLDQLLLAVWRDDTGGAPACLINPASPQPSAPYVAVKIPAAVTDLPSTIQAVNQIINYINNVTNNITQQVQPNSSGTPSSSGGLNLPPSTFQTTQVFQQQVQIPVTFDTNGNAFAEATVTTGFIMQDPVTKQMLYYGNQGV